MRVLIAGNSQAGAMFRAAQGELRPDMGDVELYFYVIPGGTGPYFRVADDRLVVTSFNEQFPPYKDPPDVDQQDLSSFDAVVVSALGYIDGGFQYSNPIVSQGIVPEFDPLPEAAGQPLISQATLRAVVRHGLLTQPGYTFLRELSKTYGGRILVQPFPHLSDYMLERDDWPLRKFYRDVEGANRYLAALRDDTNAEICKELGVELLDYPDPAFHETGFTPRRLMRDSDGLHPEAEYGAMVLSQIAALMRQPSMV